MAYDPRLGRFAGASLLYLFHRRPCRQNWLQGPLDCHDQVRHLITTHLADRLLGQNRLATLLTSLTEKRASSGAKVRERGNALQAEIAQADDKLRRLYKMVEDGVTDLDEVLGDRLAAA